MERIVYRKTIDVHKSGIQFTLQGFGTADNLARRIELTLMSSGDTMDFPSNRITALMYIKTPNSKEPSINSCEINGNVIIYDVLPIREEGITEMQLKIIETSRDGARYVMATPKFAIEVTESNIDDWSAEHTTTFTALEDALAKAETVYAERFMGIDIDSECTFRAYYADGTIYETDVLKRLFKEDIVYLSRSWARGGTGVRAGEDTDNSMYYSNVSKSITAGAKKLIADAVGLLTEARKHGVYTTFSVDFSSGEVMYDSPSYSFNVDKTSGDLIATSQN